MRSYMNIQKLNQANIAEIKISYNLRYIMLLGGALYSEHDANTHSSILSCKNANAAVWSYRGKLSNLGTLNFRNKHVKEFQPNSKLGN